MLKYVTILSCLFFTTAGSLHAQALSGKDSASSAKLRAYRLQQIQEAIKEHTHLPDGGIPGQPGLKEDEEESTFATPYDTNERISTNTNRTAESEVDAALNPTDTANIIVAPIHLDSKGMALPIYYTTNFGVSWNKSSFQPLPFENNGTVSGGGDPVLAFDADDTVYMTWMDDYSSQTLGVPGIEIDSSLYGMYWAYSTNSGQTWQRSAKGYVAFAFEKISINTTTGAETLDSNGGFNDKEWIAVDRSNSKYRNSLYVSWTYLGTTSSNIMVRRKIPGLDSMQPAVKASSDTFEFVQYTSLGIDANGGLHVTFLGSYDLSNFGMFTVYSSDGGAHFGREVKISDVDIPNRSADAIADGYQIYGIRQAGNYPCAHLSIDTAAAGTGNLYEVWCALGVEADSGLGSQIYFSSSADNGSTWSQPSIINNDLDTETSLPDHFYPSIAVNGRGTISVTWYDRREDPGNVIGRYYIGQSTDQGQTWTNAPVASKPMDFSQVMDLNMNYQFGIGEYTQILTTPNYVVPVWTDGRDNTGNLRVYAALLYSDPLVSVSLLNAQASAVRLSTVTEGLELSDNFPNPFSSTTKLSFTLGTSAHARLYVTNIAGQTIASLFDGTAEAGEHDFVFDGSHLANGVYYLNLESDLGIVRRAMTILR